LGVYAADEDFGVKAGAGVNSSLEAASLPFNLPLNAAHFRRDRIVGRP